jgi:hypothetical protein
VRIAKEVQAFVESDSRETLSKRNRLRQIVLLIVRRLRQEVMATVNAVDPARRPPQSQYSSLEGTEKRLERCLVVLQQIDANANLSTLIECWIDDLGQTFAWSHRSTARPQRSS